MQTFGIMGNRGLYVIAFSAYLLFICGLIASVLMVEDETERIMFMSILSTGMVTFSVIFALFISRGSASERYEELYMSGEEDEESK